MQLLPSGFALPALPYLLVVALGSLAILGLLYRRAPRVTPRVVTAFAPWMVAGATGYALFQVDAVPSLVRPLFGNPIVYATTFLLAGVVWLASADYPSDRWSFPSVPGVIGATGIGVAGTLLAYAVAVGVGRDSLSLFWPGVGLVASVALAAVTWLAARDRVGVTGTLGGLVLFGHVLDGVSTAVGTHLGFGEQTPLSSAVIEFGAGLPVAPYLGDAWLFVVVKLLLAVVVLYLFTDYVREEPAEGSLLLGIVAAVGLGPGAHNLVLFALA